MVAADMEGRIGVYLYVPGYPVHTLSDIGMDDTNSVWLFQVLPSRVRMIGYFEHVGSGMDGMIDELERRKLRLASSTARTTCRMTFASESGPGRHDAHRGHAQGSQGPRSRHRD